MNLAKFLAVKTAFKSQHHRWRLGAVLVHSREILSASPNLPRLYGKERGICAETRLITKSIINGTVIYVARVKADGTLGLARPCEDCMRLIRSRGIRTVYYTNETGSWERFKV